MRETITDVKSKFQLILAGLMMTLCTAFAPTLVYAVESPTQPTAGDAGGFVPCGNTVDNPCNVTHLFRAFIVIINYLISMAGFVAVFAIIYAGLQMVMSAGTERLAAAKKRMAGAIIGLVIVAAAYVLINALFSGSFSIGICEGEKILSDPKAYINSGADSCQ